MICPKCGRPVVVSAVICRGCDFILDTNFLGDGILDVEHSLRPGTGGVDPAAFNLADAVILGNIDEDSQSFETSDSGFHMRHQLNARLYVSGRSQALMAPDAVPALVAPLSDHVKLTPFEKHVLAFIDGKRPVEVIRRAAGLEESEVKTALATLADKGVVKVVGRALADFDPDIDTSVRRPAQRPRIRGSDIGAVALVGDAADRAIEEAFRTSVALSAPSLSSATPRANARDNHETSDVFSREQLRERPRARPMKGEESIDASAEASAIDKSILEHSDGFDDFGLASNVETAVRAQEFSESSAPSITGVSAFIACARQPSGVFEDVSDGEGPPLMGSLADSRVQLRPNLNRQPLALSSAKSTALPSASAELLSSAYAAAVPRQPVAARWPVGAESDASADSDASDGDVWVDTPPQPQPLEKRRENDSPDGMTSMLPFKESAAGHVVLEAPADADDSSEQSSEDATRGGVPMPVQLLPKVQAPAAADDDVFATDSVDSSFEAPGTDPLHDDSDQSTHARSEAPASTGAPSQAPADLEDSQLPSSTEMVDSALVVRPALRPPPSAKAVSPSAREVPGTSASQEEEGRFADALSHEPSDAGQDDSDETLSLDAEQQRRRFARGMPSGGNVVRAQGGGAALMSSDSSQAVEAAAPFDSKNRLIEENRRKASQLFDEAQKEAAAGKMGAARMNAKLASIYDPANQEYRGQIEVWERPTTPERARGSARPALRTRPSNEEQAEIKALYDEAQRCEDEGDVDAALDILERGLERFQNAAAFHNRIGVVLALRKRDYQGAVHAIQRAIDIDPDNLHYKSNLGKIVARMRGPRAEA